jgi:Zn ribbon nucleic-acid-binding protein
MILSMFNRMEFPFACPKCRRVERIIISRLDNVTQWPCEHCGHRTDLTEEHLTLSKSYSFAAPRAKATKGDAKKG